MPTYAYRCRKCAHEFEEFHSIKDDKPRKCPECGARADRVPSGGAGLLFKGSGFYITDYRSASYQEKAKKESAGGEGAKQGEGGAKSEGGAKGEGGGKSESGTKSEGGGKRESGGKREGGGKAGESRSSRKPGRE